MTEYILFVDDEKLIKKLVSHYFRNQIRQGKYEFIFALNGIEALEKLQANSAISLVITDINMPEMDGLTLLERIRESYEDTKTIIISAYEDLKTIRKAMNLGAVDFLNKPLDFQDLENSINLTLNYLYQSKADKSLNQASQIPKFQNPQDAIVNQLISHSVRNIDNPANQVSDHLAEAQAVVKDMISKLHIYQQQFTDILPENMQQIASNSREEVLSEFSQIMKILKEGTERLEQIDYQLKQPIV